VLVNANASSVPIASHPAQRRRPTEIRAVPSLRRRCRPATLRRAVALHDRPRREGLHVAGRDPPGHAQAHPPPLASDAGDGGAAARMPARRNAVARLRDALSRPVGRALRGRARAIRRARRARAVSRRAARVQLSDGEEPRRAALPHGARTRLHEGEVPGPRRGAQLAWRYSCAASGSGRSRFSPTPFDWTTSRMRPTFAITRMS
jgi:hypothetical protein